jgi:transposase-like protein
MPSNEPVTTAHPDPEVRPKAKRRQFTTEYKKRILNESDACATPAERGALVRREGLYSSHLNAWRRQRDQGILDGFGPKKRGPKRNPLAIENARLQRENERLQKQLQRAETIIEIQKKVSQLLGIPLAENPLDDTNSSKR